MSIREFIQKKLNELETNNIEVGTELPDEMLIENKIYFSYLLNSNYRDSDFDKNYTYDVSIIGYLKIKTSPEIDSLEKIDFAKDLLKNKLKEINFKSSFTDVSITDEIRKVRVIATAKYNEINKIII